VGLMFREAPRRWRIGQRRSVAFPYGIAISLWAEPVKRSETTDGPGIDSYEEIDGSRRRTSQRRSRNREARGMSYPTHVVTRDQGPPVVATGHKSRSSGRFQRRWRSYPLLMKRLTRSPPWRKILSTL